MQTIAGCAPKAPLAGGQHEPTVSYWHVSTDEDRVSHQTRRELSAFKLLSILAGAAPEWIDRLSNSGAAVLLGGYHAFRFQSNNRIFRQALRFSAG